MKKYITAIIITICCKWFWIELDAQQHFDSSYVVMNCENCSGPRSKYHFLKKKNIQKTSKNSSRIDTNAIYLYFVFDQVAGDTSFYYIRFYSNSIAFISLPYKGLIKEEYYESYFYGKYCAYKISRNKLIVETYKPFEFPEYSLLYFRILSDGNMRYYKSRIGRLITNGTIRDDSFVQKKKYNFKSREIKWNSKREEDEKK